MRNGLNFKTFVIFSTPNQLGVWRNVYALVLGTSLARGGGSSPLTPTRMTTILGLIASVVSKFKSKFVAVNVALKKKCCKVERVCIEGFNSKGLASLRNYPPNSYIPTTAYFLAIPTSFFLKSTVCTSG